MYSSINHLNNHILPLTNENWLSILSKPVNERSKFEISQGTLHIGQVVARFLGLPADEDEYYNHLFEYVHEYEFGLNLLSEETLNKSIDNRHFQAIQKVIQINQEQNLSINRFVAFLDGEQLIAKSSIPSLHRQLREALISTLKLFAETEKDGLQNGDLRRVLVDTIKWSINHLQSEIDQADPEKRMPKFLWYGNYKKSHQYFLFYLLKTGCDIVVFNPSGEDVLSNMDPKEEATFVHRYPDTKEAEPFPTEKRSRKSTVAYRASKEIETILNHEGSGLYKPWQLRDYTPSSITLKTTYDELFLILKEHSMIRPDFEVENGNVKIPNVFAKIQGVSKNRKEYWDRIHTISQLEQSLLIREFPFSIRINNDFRFHYRSALDKDGLLNIDKMMQAHYWKYQQLPIGLQKGIGTAIRNICARPGLKALHHESIEEVQVYLFTQGMQIPANMLQLLQKFDYAQAVPKLILYNNEMKGTLTRSDAALLLLLNQFGLDIVIYNPPGHNDIENYIDDRLYDTHWLEDLVFEQEYREPSKIKRVFFHSFLKNLRGD